MVCLQMIIFLQMIYYHFIIFNILYLKNTIMNDNFQFFRFFQFFRGLATVAEDFWKSFRAYINLVKRTSLN